MYVCFVYVQMYSAYVDINDTQTHIHQLEHRQSKQRFHCSFCWPLILRPPAPLLPIPPVSEAHLYIL